MRLAAIDAPELTSAAGKKAHAFVEQALTNANAIAVKTRRIDRYGRFLAYVFFATKDSEADKLLRQGRYLNAELVKHELATSV